MGSTGNPYLPSAVRVEIGISGLGNGTITARIWQWS